LTVKTREDINKLEAGMIKDIKKVSANELNSLMFFVSNSKNEEQRDNLIGNYTINGFNILIRKNRPLTSSEKFKRHYVKRRKLGLCVQCGSETSINPRTKKNYRYCNIHREEEKARKKAIRDNKLSSRT
jgi:hypothetical protein